MQEVHSELTELYNKAVEGNREAIATCAASLREMGDQIQAERVQPFSSCCSMSQRVDSVPRAGRVTAYYTGGEG